MGEVYICNEMRKKRDARSLELHDYLAFGVGIGLMSLKIGASSVPWMRNNDRYKKPHLGCSAVNMSLLPTKSSIIIRHKVHVDTWLLRCDFPKGSSI